MLKCRALAMSFSFALMLVSQLLAGGSPKKDLQATLDQLQDSRKNIKRSTAPLLILVKRVESAVSGVQDKVKVIDSGASVREANSEAARVIYQPHIGDEMVVLQHLDVWYEVRLQDGRNGWVREENVQSFSVAISGQQELSDLELANIGTLAGQLMKRIVKQEETAANLIASFDKQYQRLSPSEKSEVNALHEAFLSEKQKVASYAAYARHFFAKIPISEHVQGVRAAGGRPGFNGQLSVLMGKSAFESGAEESETSRHLNFLGSMILNPQSRVTANVNHVNEVIQTPYTTTDIRLGYIRQGQRGKNYEGYFAFKTYDDKNFDRNNFKDVGAGIKARHPLGKRSRFIGDVFLNSKNYDESGSNDYSGGRFNTALQFNSGQKNRIDVGVRGRIQSSDISFLDFRRFIPNFSYRGENFNLKAELEQISYDAEAESNDFTREQFDLLWGRSTAQRGITVMAKQFSNNEDFNYIKGRIHGRWQKINGSGFSRTGLSLLYVHHPNGGDAQTDYFDLRADRSKSGSGGFLNLSLFSRIWQSSDRDHIMDIYSRFGWKKSHIQFGPVLGAHLLLDADDIKLKRDGNSLRAGFEARGNFRINKSTVYGSISYERSFVYGSQISIDPTTGQVTTGEVETRNPTTLQFAAGLRAPVSRTLDVQVDIRHYNINLDVDNQVSINPIESRSSLKLQAGLVYRFSR